MLDHRQPQPGALEFARQAAVDLAERLEQLVHVALRDANSGVADTHLQKMLIVTGWQREAVYWPVAAQNAHLCTRHLTHCEGHPAAGFAELHRIGQQVVDNLLGLAPIQFKHAEVGLGFQLQLDALQCGLLADDQQAVAQQFVQIDGFKLQQHHSGFDLGQVEDVIDQRQQVLAAVENVTDVAALGIGHVTDHAVFERLRKADDGVERGAQLVGHGGEKFGLHMAGVFQLDVFLFQRALEAFALGHVPGRGKHALELAVAIMKGCRVVGNHGFGAIVGAHGKLIVADLVFTEHPLDRGVGTCGVGEEVFAGRTDQFVAGSPGQRHHLFVDVGDDALRVGHHQRINVRFDQ